MLLILTDGIISDMAQTKEAIVNVRITFTMNSFIFVVVIIIIIIIIIIVVVVVVNCLLPFCVVL